MKVRDRDQQRSINRHARSPSLRRNLLLGTASAALFLLFPVAPAFATKLPATFTENTTLTAAGSPYTGSSTIQAGVTVKVEPGVKFVIGGLTVTGTLKAEGTAAEPIVFTGTKEEKQDEWGQIVLGPGAGESVLDHVEIAYGGQASSGFSEPTVEVLESSPRITNSVFRKDGIGIKVPRGGSPEVAYNLFIEAGEGFRYISEGSQSGEVLVHDNVFENTGSSPIKIEENGTSLGSGTLSGNTVEGAGEKPINYSGVDIPGDITHNTLRSNTHNWIGISGTVSHSSTWEDGGSRLVGSFTVASGVTLHVSPGVEILPSIVTVNGTLDAEGTAAEPVVFTSKKEEKLDEWGYIVLGPGAGGSVLDHVEVAYGGSAFNGFSRAVVEVVESAPRITNSVFKKDGIGIKAPKGGAPEVAHDRFVEAGGFSFVSKESQSGEILVHDNVFESSDIEIEENGTSLGSGTLSGNTIEGAGEKPIKYSGVDIPGDITHNTLRANTHNWIAIAGMQSHSATWEAGEAILKAQGEVTIAPGVTLTVKRGVIFLPSKITVKGTLDSEGTASEPVVLTGTKEEKGGEWTVIKFEPGSGESVLDHTEIAYGGSGTNGMIEAKASHPTITNSTLRKSSGYAIKVTESGTPRIEWNRFRNNANGLSYTGTGKLAAPNNDWNCANGPKPAGCGDSVTNNVEWKPAAQLPELNGPCRGKQSQCGEGADPVSLATGALNYSHRDLVLTNKSAVPLEFARSYYSGSAEDTGLGPGWSQTGLASITELASGEVLVVRQDGRQDLFQKTESGYQPPSGVTDALAKVEGTFQLTTLQNTVYRFDSSGRIASITDDHGLKTTYAYNAEGRLATITDASAQTLTFSYNSSNHITSVKDSTGREVKFTYSAAGDLEAATDALGGVTKYAYDAQHRLTQITDPRGNVILKNTYDSQGRITEQRDGLEDLWKLSYSSGETTVTEPEGGKRKYGFDSQNRVVSETDQLGHATTTSYDSAGNISKVIEPGGAEWSFGHDAAGNLTSAEDPEGGERSYEYDSKNRLTRYTDARGGTWSYEWSAANDLTKITDPEGGETAFTYNSSGQPLTATDPDKHKSEFSWDTRGNRLSATDPLGHKTSFEYNSRNYLTAKTLPGLKAESFEVDALGDVLAQTTPEGHKTKYAYDANGLPTQVTDPAEGIWKIERNAMERPTAYTDPLGQQTKISYNGDLQPTKVVNRRGKETSYAYDLANQLTEVARPEGEVWEYGYDARGNRSSMVDPRGHETTYAYDLLDRITAAEEPLSVTTKYGYDANGEVTEVTDPRANATSYGYDKDGRLTEIAQPLEATTTYTYDPAGNELAKTIALSTLEYGYDAANRLTSIEAGESTLRSYGYDSANRLTAATDAEGHKIEVGYTEEGRPSSIKDGRGQSLTRSYDSRGNLVKQVDGRGTLEYGYDKLDRMTSLTDPQGKSLGFAYDPEGDLTEVTRPDGVTTTNVYNEAGRLAETTSKTAEPLTVLESLKYGYDAAGNVTSKVDQPLEAETSYAYDALNRLAEFNPPGEGATSYGYDAAGNRTEAGGTTYSFNALNQLTEDSAGTTYSYDGAGRLAGEINGSEETSFGWDPLDHLAKVEGPGGSATYAFDGLERLSERNSGEAAQVFHYGDLGDLATYETNGEGKATTSFVQGARGLVEQRSGEATSFPLVDGHGDVTAIANGGGGVESRRSFDPWGNQLSGPTLEMGYLGAWERPSDPTSGLIQMGARSYAPSLGSFVSEDPVLGHLGIGISVNRYPYVWDNPSNRYDLNGRDICVFKACAGDVAESAEELPGELEEGWEQVERGAGQVGSSVGSAAERGWEWTAPGRRWIADRAQDFWKKYGSPIESVYKFAGANWEGCVKGAVPGALIGGSGGTAFFGIGALPGSIGGGVLGCGSVVGSNQLLEVGL